MAADGMSGWAVACLFDRGAATPTDTATTAATGRMRAGPIPGPYRARAQRAPGPYTTGPPPPVPPDGGVVWLSPGWSGARSQTLIRPERMTKLVRAVWPAPGWHAPPPRPERPVRRNSAWTSGPPTRVPEMSFAPQGSAALTASAWARLWIVTS